jgi:WD40 repeat protein
LTSDQVEGDVFVAGFGDGAIRVYDQRQKPATAMVKVWKEHKQWITNVHLQRGGQRELVSGCRSGEVKLWDIRMDKSVKTIVATTDHLRTLSVHEHAPVFATYVSLVLGLVPSKLTFPVERRNIASRFSISTVASLCPISNHILAFFGTDRLQLLRLHSIPTDF